MQVSEFKRIVAAFADTPSSVDIARGEFAVQLREEVLVAKLEREDGNLFVVENGVRFGAHAWILERVAKLPLLAERILSTLPSVEPFVTPSAQILSSLEQDPTSAGRSSANAVVSTKATLDEQIPGTTSVVYLTSDAGEGKTTLINFLAREIAKEFKARRSKWVLLPVLLGGRAFLRFDELTVGALMNRFRFPYWFYDGFVELVRMGAVIPAFDGFEEMIVEGTSGEAVSALGNLVNQLNSEGSVLVAARRAFFEYQSFRTQARLFDAIGREDSVSFSRVSLDRWTFSEFEQYGKLRGEKDYEAIYDQIAAKFGKQHPLLTRAVLVRRLFDVAETAGEIGRLIERMGHRPQDYFHQFVLAIIEREAGEKWLDKEGREGQVLLGVQQHVELLSWVAREMWISSMDALRFDVLDVVADLYCEDIGKSPAMARQIKERLRHHALLVSSQAGRAGVGFDHEDFRMFFTGVALAGLLRRGTTEDLRGFLKIASVPDSTADEAVLIFCRDAGEADIGDLIVRLLEVAIGELPTSFVLENVGGLVLRLIEADLGTKPLTIRGLTLGSNALRARTVRAVTFEECYFAPTSLYKSRLENVVFRSCKFERIELSDESSCSAQTSNCEVLCVIGSDTETVAFDPRTAAQLLAAAGITEVQPHDVEGGEPAPSDIELTVADKAVRIFLRATQVNEGTFKVRLGNLAPTFFDVVLPRLEDLGVFQETQYKGSGVQRRYRLTMPMSRLQEAISGANGSFERFALVLGTPGREGPTKR